MSKGISHVKLILDDTEQMKVKELKTVYGLKANSELVRFLITEAYKEVLKSREKEI